MSELRIAYLGPAGTWSEAAALRYAGSSATLLPFTSMGGVVSAVETGLAGSGVLPVENSLEGAVGTTLDLLIHETRLRINAEVVEPIRHVLVARPGARVDQISVLRSHPQALAQCRRFIERCLPRAQTVAALSTAAAVDEMLGDEHGAAIATPRAAELYPVEVLGRDIQDRDSNATRFVVLGTHDSPPTGDDKTSLCFSVRHNRPGALVEILQLFAAAGINLSKVESRPAGDQLGEYIFLLDLDGHREDPPIAAVLAQVERMTEFLKIFGSYPAWRSDERATARQQQCGR